ncbi:hypothetical protein CL656_04100 [bacterium]|nr:hypothetical protein [bacterium]|tara:strand:+ start:2358 stop:3011 length:654 start_codon:yes stop_codon:yes gene_type:complete
MNNLEIIQLESPTTNIEQRMGRGGQYSQDEDTIRIFDTQNPNPTFLHELGHAIIATQLEDDNIFKILQKDLTIDERAILIKNQKQKVTPTIQRIQQIKIRETLLNLVDPNLENESNEIIDFDKTAELQMIRQLLFEIKAWQIAWRLVKKYLLNIDEEYMINYMIVCLSTYGLKNGIEKHREIFYSTQDEEFNEIMELIENQKILDFHESTQEARYYT